jgi:hypothetical protein
MQFDGKNESLNMEFTNNILVNSMLISVQNYKLYYLQAYCFKRFFHLISQIHWNFPEISSEGFTVIFFINCNYKVIQWTSQLISQDCAVYINRHH